MVNTTEQKIGDGLPSKQVIADIISVRELTKFLNSHERLGMTDEQQKKYVDAIDFVSEKIAEKIKEAEN